MGKTSLDMVHQTANIRFCFRWVLLVSVLALLPPVVLPANLPVVYGGFIIFEVCVGLFWPSMGFMRGIYVPEAGNGL